MDASRNGSLALDRRTLLAVSGAALMAGAAGPLSAATSTASRIRYVVTDRRIPESIAFADALVGMGAIRLEATQGVTHMWQQVLRPHWRGAAGATVGLTSIRLWQCLAEQARGEHRRAQRLGRHRLETSDGTASHIVLHTADASVLATRMAGQATWPAISAHLAARCVPAPGGTLRETSCRSPQDATADHTMLTSWMIS